MRLLNGLDRSDVIDEVRSKADIVTVVQEYVQLQRSGESYKGLCPFHSERTPSFHVNPKKRIYHCFGCNETGDVFNFLMRLEGISFNEALVRLAASVGLEVPGHDSPMDSEATRLRQAAFEAHALAVKLYRGALVSETAAGAKAAREYLIERGITRQDVTNFMLGFAPDDWSVLSDFLVGKGFELSFLVEVGLISQSQSSDKYFDRFRNRVMFPILDDRGRAIGFGGRAMTDSDESQPKYLNSPETPIFIKGRSLFGLYQAREAMRAESRAILVEGYMDVIASHRAGLKTAVASLGTALTDAQAHIFSRFVREVVICYDSDSAGLEASAKAFQVLARAGLRVRIASLSGAKDPDELVCSQGAQALETAVAAALPPVEWRMMHLRNERDLSSPYERAQAVQELVPLILAIPNAIERAEYTKVVSQKMMVPQYALEEEMHKAASQAGKQMRPVDMATVPRNTMYRDNMPTGPAQNRMARVESGILSAVEGAETELIALMVNDLELSAEIESEVALGQVCFSVETNRAAAQALFEVVKRTDGRIDSKASIVEQALAFTDDVGVRKLLGRLALEERPVNDALRIKLDCLSKMREHTLLLKRAGVYEEMLACDAEGRCEARTQCMRRIAEIDDELRRCKGPKCAGA